MSSVESLLGFVTRLSLAGRRRRAEQVELVRVKWIGRFGHAVLFDGTELEVCVHDDSSGAGARFIDMELVDIDGDPDAQLWFECERNRAQLVESWDARSFRWN